MVPYWKMGLVLESLVTGPQKDHNQTGLRLQKTKPTVWSFDFSDVLALASKPEPSLAKPKNLGQARPTVQALGGFRPGS